VVVAIRQPGSSGHFFPQSAKGNAPRGDASDEQGSGNPHPPRSIFRPRNGHHRGHQTTGLPGAAGTKRPPLMSFRAESSTAASPRTSTQEAKEAQQTAGPLLFRRGGRGAKKDALTTSSEKRPWNRLPPEKPTIGTTPLSPAEPKAHPLRGPSPQNYLPESDSAGKEGKKSWGAPKPELTSGPGHGGLPNGRVLKQAPGDVTGIFRAHKGNDLLIQTEGTRPRCLSTYLRGERLNYNLRPRKFPIKTSKGGATAFISHRFSLPRA